MGRLRRMAIARQSSIVMLGLVETRRREEEKARKIAVLEGLLRNWQSWRAILEDSGIETLVVGGEEWNFYAMLNGIKDLPPRQKQALWQESCSLDQSASSGRWRFSIRMMPWPNF